MTEVVGILIFSCLAAMFVFGSAALPVGRDVELRSPAKSSPADHHDRSKDSFQDTNDRIKARKERKHKIRQMCDTYVQTYTPVDEQLTAKACFAELQQHPEYETLFAAPLSDVELYTRVVELLSSMARNDLTSA